MKRIYVRPVSVVVVVLVGLSLYSGPFDGGFGLVRPAMATLPDDSPGATVTTTVEPACDFPGLQFTLEVCNDATTTMYNIVISETLPTGLSFSGPASLAAVDSSGNPIDVGLCQPVTGQTIEICPAVALAPGECVIVTFRAHFAEALCNHVVVTASGGAGGTGDEGCTPGFWKNHFAAWGPTMLDPAADFDATFAVSAFSEDRTLEQAVKQGGGGKKALARHAVAALLNAAHPDVNYAMTTAEVIALVQQALAPGGDMEAAKDTLEAYNELGCPVGEEGGDDGGQPVWGTEMVCLDELGLLGGMVDCLCDGGGTCPDPCSIGAYCELGLEEECDPAAIDECIWFEFWNFFEFELIPEFYEERCADCCDDPSDCPECLEWPS